MKPSYLQLSCLALAVLLSAGCGSNGIANRINEKSAVFASLSAADKQNIEEGMIYPGYTDDMTYIALGKPSSVETKQKDGATVEMWAYKKFYPSGRLEYTLTEYSRANNPNLQRDLGLQSGRANVGDHTPNPGGSNPGGGGIGSATGTASGGDPGLSLPDIPVYNLYVFFSDNKIVDIKLESLDGTKF